jgi:hypothetical protein
VDKIIEKLERITQLWKELRQTKPRTIEYNELLKKIRALSAEYQTLAEAKDTPDNLE